MFCQMKCTVNLFKPFTTFQQAHLHYQIHNFVTLTTAVYELLMLLPKDEHAQCTPALCYTGEIVAAAAAATAAQFS